MRTWPIAFLGIVGSACGGVTSAGAPEDAAAASDASTTSDSPSLDSALDAARLDSALDAARLDSALDAARLDSATLDSTSVAEEGTTTVSCQTLFSGTGCLSSCVMAQQSCAMAGQSVPFESFLTCLSSTGFSCNGQTVDLNGGSCNAQAVAIVTCSSGMAIPDAGPG